MGNCAHVNYENIIPGSVQKSLRVHNLHTLMSSLKILQFFSQKYVMLPFRDF